MLRILTSEQGYEKVPCLLTTHGHSWEPWIPKEFTLDAVEYEAGVPHPFYEFGTCTRWRRVSCALGCASKEACATACVSHLNARKTLASKLLTSVPVIFGANDNKKAATAVRAQRKADKKPQQGGVGAKRAAKKAKPKKADSDSDASVADDEDDDADEDEDDDGGEESDADMEVEDDEKESEDEEDEEEEAAEAEENEEDEDDAEEDEDEEDDEQPEADAERKTKSRKT